MSREISPLQTLVQAFPGIPMTEARELIAGGEMHTYPAGTILCLEDAFESTFYIILSGQVQVTKAISSEQVRQLKTLEAGDFFGEMALLQDAPRAATVTTSQPTTVLEITKDFFNDLMGSSASVSRAMVQEVVARLRANDQMAIEDLRLKAGELAAAYQQLAELEYSRREFLSMIAHELRTPLTAASGFLHMIESGMLRGQALDSDMQQAALHNASRNMQHIVSLVNDILFIQEMDLILPRFEAVDLVELLEGVVRITRPKADDTQVTVHLQAPPDLPPAYGDAKSLERAFCAIVDNAIKFSYENSRVNLQITSRPETNQLQIDIHDQGVGIPEDILPRIFDRFFRIDEIDGRMFRGAGLGLSIARQVIEQHQGQIQVSSEPQKGTTVTVLLKSYASY